MGQFQYLQFIAQHTAACSKKFNEAHHFSVAFSLRFYSNVRSTPFFSELTSENTLFWMRWWCLCCWQCIMKSGSLPLNAATKSMTNCKHVTRSWTRWGQCHWMLNTIHSVAFDGTSMTMLHGPTLSVIRRFVASSSLALLAFRLFSAPRAMQSCTIPWFAFAEAEARIKAVSHKEYKATKAWNNEIAC